MQPLYLLSPDGFAGLMVSNFGSSLNGSHWEELADLAQQGLEERKDLHDKHRRSLVKLTKDVPRRGVGRVGRSSRTVIPVLALEGK
jgi:hypothetical protein